MTILINTCVFIFSFLTMEVVAWATHKYVMHGFLWVLHSDHHLKDHDGFFERNDYFFLIFAVPGIILMFVGALKGFDNIYFWIGAGISLYGMAYFFVHDIFIHQRFPVLKRLDIVYFRALRRAHKMHHKHLDKQDGECFGMLWVPRKYYIEAKRANHDLP